MNYKTRNIRIFLIALGLSIMIAFIVRQILFKKVDEEEKAARDVISVVVAKSDLGIGQTITRDDFKWIKWPRNSVNKDYIITDAEFQKLEGSIVRDEILSGEPVLRNSLVHVGEQGVLAAVIAPGKRAFTILLKGMANISPLISPGDYVDVIVAFRSKSEQTYEGKTVIQHVRILEIDGSFEKTKKGNTKPPRSVTIEVDNKDAEELSAALREGEPDISLYSVGSSPLNQVETPRSAQILPEKAQSLPTSDFPSSEAPSEVSSALPSPQTHENTGEPEKVTIFRGSKKEEITFK